MKNKDCKYSNNINQEELFKCRMKRQYCIEWVEKQSAQKKREMTFLKKNSTNLNYRKNSTPTVLKINSNPEQQIEDIKFLAIKNTKNLTNTN